MQQSSPAEKTLSDKSSQQISMETIETYINSRVRAEMAPYSKKIDKLIINQQQFNERNIRLQEEKEEKKKEASKSTELLAENEKLKKEVEFLKRELKSKTEIIKLIMEEKNENENEIINIEHSTSPSKANKKKTKKKDANLSNRRKTTVTILGDSIIKHIKAKHVKSNDNKVFIKSFSGSTISQMHHYAKPSLEYNPDIIILHCGTNDLRSGKNADEIANDVINLASVIKTKENDIIISSITTRSDKLQKKALDVNKTLQQLCTTKAIDFMVTSLGNI